MTRIEFAPETTDDFDRILEHLLLHEARHPSARIDEIVGAIAILEHNPLIGRPLRRTGMRELVIGRRAHGYVALYRYLPVLDIVFVLAIRGQREAGYVREYL